MGEADDAAGDLRAAGLLLALYTLQGIPMGLSGAVPLLLAGRASYAEQALLSLASLPFSLKLLWAPLVDAAYVRRWGRRKTWLVPTQLLIGATMLLSRGRVDAWVAAAAPPVPRIAAYFAALYALCATQDVAVDGWALTLLSKRRAGWAATCNGVGQSLGYALSYVGFVALHARGRVSLAAFVGACGAGFLLTTAAVALGCRERAEAGAAVAPRAAYGRALAALRLPAVRRLALVLLTCKAAFGCVDGAAQLEAVRRGLPTEAVAALAPPLLLASVALPLAAARWTAGPRPLSSAFLWGFRLRLALNPLTYVVLRCVEAAPASRRAYRAYAALALLREAGSTLMFTSMMAFFARVADPGLGGTYMTLLNTLANVGAKWPPSPVWKSTKCDGCTRQFITKSFLGNDAAVMARSSGEEPASPRHRAGVASMAWRTTRRFSTNAP